MLFKKVSLTSQWQFCKDVLKLSLTGQWQYWCTEKMKGYTLWFFIDWPLNQWERSILCSWPMRSPEMRMIPGFTWKVYLSKLSLTGQWNFCKGPHHYLCDTIQNFHWFIWYTCFTSFTWITWFAWFTWFTWSTSFFQRTCFTFFSCYIWITEITLIIWITWITL